LNVVWLHFAEFCGIFNSFKNSWITILNRFMYRIFKAYAAVATSFKVHSGKYLKL